MNNENNAKLEAGRHRLSLVHEQQNARSLEIQRGQLEVQKGQQSLIDAQKELDRQLHVRNSSSITPPNPLTLNNDLGGILKQLAQSQLEVLSAVKSTKFKGLKNSEIQEQNDSQKPC